MSSRNQYNLPNSMQKKLPKEGPSKAKQANTLDEGFFTASESDRKEQLPPSVFKDDDEVDRVDSAHTHICHTLTDVYHQMCAGFLLE